ncbi:hypothetical protein PMAYCL1PPCAC_32469, partial [Pristionchus mayeri]
MSRLLLLIAATAGCCVYTDSITAYLRCPCPVRYGKFSCDCAGFAGSQCYPSCMNSCSSACSSPICVNQCIGSCQQQCQGTFFSPSYGNSCNSCLDRCYSTCSNRGCISACNNNCGEFCGGSFNVCPVNQYPCGGGCCRTNLRLNLHRLKQL